MGHLEVVWMNLEAEDVACSLWQALTAGDFGMGSFIFDGPFNSVLKSRVLSQKIDLHPSSTNC